MTRIGSLCTGYGGLDAAVIQVLGGSVAWHCEIDPDASRVLAHHWPDVPNHGDLTAVDWTAVEPVDVLTAGYPCQPESDAGKRRSTEDERWIWPAIADAIRTLRPRRVLLENVRGHVGRGLRTVLGDLAGIGYDARWDCLRASDVGAPHERRRVFIAASPAHTGRNARPGDHSHGPTAARRGEDAADTDHDRPRWRGTGEQPRGTTAGRGCRSSVDWGDYAPAIARWERILGRPAPAPTVPSRTGTPVLNPVLVEWLMGLPAGWVTDVPGLSRTAQLRILGNGVCPQQAALAYRLILADPIALTP